MKYHVNLKFIEESIKKLVKTKSIWKRANLLSLMNHTKNTRVENCISRIRLWTKIKILNFLIKPIS
jgi:hypothetical protein